ncbi:MAG: right-handed parallel beta-helix repeat-containing protein [Rikenellaceae bacterium]
MKRKLFWLGAVAMLLSSCMGGSVEYYVSPQGSDSNDGSLESPFATITKAQEAIRSLSQAERKSNISVYIRGGEYKLSQRVRFGVEDSAPDGYKYSYEAYGDEEPRFTSNHKLSEWSEEGELYVTTYPAEYEKPYILYNGDHMIQRSKKEGFDIVNNTPLSLDEHKEVTGKNEYNASRSMNVYYDEDRYLLKQFDVTDPDKILREWSAEDEIEVAFAPVPWALNILPVERVDLKNGTIYTSIEANAPAGAKTSHTAPWIENALEYITPGTFVTRGNKIYYSKKGGEDLSKFTMPTMVEYFIVEGDIDYDGEDRPVKNLQFKGLTFANANRDTWSENHKGWGIQHDWDKFDAANAMFRFRGAESCTIDECRFTTSANSAIRLDLYCQDITIQNSLIDYVGHMGILLCGYGPGTKDVNKGNTITNNLIHHVGQVITHGAGVFMWQSGENLVSHNLIHHVPRKGIGVCGVRMPIIAKKWCDFDEASKTIRWDEMDMDNFNKYQSGEMSLGEYWMTCLGYLHARNNRIEYNEVYRALEYLGDGSVINVSGAGEGNVVSNNYVHHIASHASGVLRTDDWQRGSLFEKNIIYHSNIAGAVHKGFNDIIGNIFVDCSCKESIRWASYPDEEADYGSRVEHNIFYESEDKANYYRESYRASEGISLPHNSQTDNNLFYVAKDMKDAKLHVEMWQQRGIEKGSVAADPQFVGGAIPPFMIAENSPAYKIGFEAIDFGKIGLTDSFPAKYLKLDIPDDSRQPNFHRQRSSGEALYDFW